MSQCESSLSADISEVVLPPGRNRRLEKSNYYALKGGAAIGGMQYRSR